MFIINVELKMTENKGLGVFATKDIINGTHIWVAEDILTKKITDFEYSLINKIGKDFISKYATHHKEKGYYYLDLDHSRFMNHSKNPNTNFEGEHVGFTTRDIKKGEEITCDYTTLSDEERSADSLGFEDIEAISCIESKNLNKAINNFSDKMKERALSKIEERKGQSKWDKVPADQLCKALRYKFLMYDDPTLTRDQAKKLLLDIANFAMMTHKAIEEGR